VNPCVKILAVTAAFSRPCRRCQPAGSIRQPATAQTGGGSAMKQDRTGRARWVGGRRPAACSATSFRLGLGQGRAMTAPRPVVRRRPCSARRSGKSLDQADIAYAQPHDADRARELRPRPGPGPAVAQRAKFGGALPARVVAARAYTTDGRTAPNCRRVSRQTITVGGETQQGFGPSVPPARRQLEDRASNDGRGPARLFAFRGGHMTISLGPAAPPWDPSSRCKEKSRFA